MCVYIQSNIHKYVSIKVKYVFEILTYYICFITILLEISQMCQKVSQ